jgi:hypothetical protein
MRSLDFIDPSEAVAEAERQLRAEAETIIRFAGLLLSVGVHETAAGAVDDARAQWLRLVRDPELVQRLAAAPGDSEVARLLLQRLEGRPS